MWTSLGFVRQQRAVAEAKASYDAALASVGEEQHRQSLLQEEQRLDGVPSKVERDMLYQMWKSAEVLYGRLQPLPSIISTDRGCTGLVAKVRHLDDEMITKRGLTEIFVIGGLGEADTDGKLRVYSVDSPLGRAVKGREVGDTVMVRTPTDGYYDVEILSFETLNAFLERLPTSLDVLDAAQLELGFRASPA
jgi:hypothetical protein